MAEHSGSDNPVEQARTVRQERRDPRPEPEEVAPGVVRIQLPISLPGLGHVNCYVLQDADGVTLVDPGLPGPRTRRALRQQLAAIDVPLDRVHTVVVTHSHPDHFGQIPYFKRAGAKVITHRSFRTFLDPEAEADEEDLEVVPLGSSCHHDQADWVRSTGGAGPLRRETPWGGKPYQLPLRRRITYGLMRRAAGRLYGTPTPTDRVDDASVLTLGGREWISVHTPGHTRDHLCLWNPADGIMISGDHVLPTITPHISGTSDDIDPLASFFESLERMGSFGDTTTVLPAHGLTFDDLGDRADAIARHHHERLDVLREAGDTLGLATVEQYMKVLFRSRSWGSMAESETFAHLKHLVLIGDAVVDSEQYELRFAIG